MVETSRGLQRILAFNPSPSTELSTLIPNVFILEKIECELRDEQLKRNDYQHRESEVLSIRDLFEGTIRKKTVNILNSFLTISQIQKLVFKQKHNKEFMYSRIDKAWPQFSPGFHPNSKKSNSKFPTKILEERLDSLHCNRSTSPLLLNPR